jgi:hypothetical protein
MRRSLLLAALVFACLFSLMAGTGRAADTMLLGNSSVASLQDNDAAGLAEAFSFGAGASGTAHSLWIYVDSGSSASGLVAGLYADNSGHPGSLLASGSNSSLSAGQWNRVGLTPPPVLSSGTTYWLAVLGTGGQLNFRDLQRGSPGCSETSSQSNLTSLPSSWASGTGWTTCSLSAYVDGSTNSTTPPSAPTNTVLPTISGQAVQGQPLTASNGSWTGSPTGYAYQWQDCDSSGANCTDVSGATSSSYTLTSGDVGSTIRAVVSATNAGGSTAATSAATAVVSGPIVTPPPPPSNTGLPAVSGTDAQGQIVSSSDGSWTGSPTSYTYAWQDCDSSGNNCTAISGATSSSYTLAAGDVGSTIRAVVTATNAGGSTPATSAATAVVSGPIVTPPPPPSNTALPVVSGTATQGQALATSNGSWSGSPTSYKYAWQDCDSSGNNCTAVSGASSSSYTLRAGDVGHTMRAVVTATNVAGSTAATSAQTTTVSASGGGGGLPPGVTLRPIDGGPNYYCSHGFTNACADGWDNPSFFPIGPWYGTVTQQSDVTRWKDLGLNTAFRTTGNTSLSLLKANGLYAIVADDSGGPETPGMGSETVGLLSADEPSTMSSGVTTPLSTVPNSQQDGRFWYLNNTWNFIYYNGLSPIGNSAQVLDTLVATPDGSQRHIDTQSVDTYWFSGVPANMNYEGQLLYGLNGNMPASEIKCGCRYGDMVDRLRSFQTTYPAPIAQFVEDGGPYSEDTSTSDYITPPELDWGVWSSIIHGARQLIYFNHTFAGPQQSNDNLAQSYYQTVQPGQTISIYDQVKATDALIAQLAPEINSPQALGYVSVSPAAQTFSGIETRATDDNGTFTIFADSRDSETASNIPATFTTADGYTGPVTVVGENRTVPATNGVFTDTFAHGSTVHVYQIP